MLLYNSLPYDPRVVKEVRVLSNAGYSVTVLDLDLMLGNRPNPRGARRLSVLHMRLAKRNSLTGLLRFWIACLKYLIQNRQLIDVVHAHDLTGLPPAFAISILCPRIRLIYDSHETFPEAARDELSYMHYVLFLGLELVCASRVDWLISVSPSILRTLSRRIKASPFLIMNTPDVDEIKAKLGSIPRWKGPRNDTIVKIACPSTIRTRRGFEKLPEAAKILNANGENKFKFLIIGDGPFLPELKQMVKEGELEQSFVFMGRVDFAETLRITGDCDMAFALYENGWNTNSGISNKIFEYMMVGIPFIYSNLTQSLPLLKMVNAQILENPASGKDVAGAIQILCSKINAMNEISKTEIVCFLANGLQLLHMFSHQVS